MRTVVVRSPDLDGANYREEGLGAQFLEACRMATRTRNCQVIGIRLFEFQQLRQGRGPGMMQSGTDRCLDALQIDSAGRSAVAENGAKQLLYFAGDFLLDDFRRFFSWPDGMASATGRSTQIWVLTSTNC